MAGYDWHVSPESGVSVVIPTYNRAELVCEAVSSALEQAWEPLEVVVVDDASSDDSRSYLAQYWPQARVIANRENVGVAAAINLGVADASGSEPSICARPSWNSGLGSAAESSLARRNQIFALVASPEASAALPAIIIAGA